MIKSKAPTPRAIPFFEFATKVLGLQATPTWRVLLLVAIDHVQPRDLPPVDREIAKKLFGQVEQVPEGVNELMVWRLGRGSGKTTWAAALGLWTILTAPMDRVGPGMKAACVVVAPKVELAKLSIGVARELARAVPSINRLVEGDNADGFSIRRPDNGKVVHFVAVAAARGGATVRGFDILQLILDESEFFTSNTDKSTGAGYAVTDRDIYAAAEPRLQGSAVLISTPWPVKNMTAEYFDGNFGKPVDALVALGTSLFMRPGDEKLKRKIDKALSNVANLENVRREYFCEPGISGGDRLYSIASVEGAMIMRPAVTHAPKGAVLGVGGDLALEKDSSTISVVSNLRGEYELHRYLEMRPRKGAPLSPSLVIREFARVMQDQGGRGIMMDGHYRQSAKEHLESIPQDLGGPKKFLHAPDGIDGKYETYMHLQTLLNEGRIRLPLDERLKDQLLNVMVKFLPGGKTRIYSPRRAGEQGHGDIVSALVLACWAAKKKDKSAASIGTSVGYRQGGDGGLVYGSDDGAWEAKSIDGNSGQSIGPSLGRPPEGAGMTPGMLALAQHGWSRGETAS